MSRAIRRWTVAGWAALVLAGAAATLYLEDRTTAPAAPQRWERPSSPANPPTPCPTPSPGSPDTRHNCAYWERG